MLPVGVDGLDAGVLLATGSFLACSVLAVECVLPGGFLRGRMGAETVYVSGVGGSESGGGGMDTVAR